MQCWAVNTKYTRSLSHAKNFKILHKKDVQESLWLVLLYESQFSNYNLHFHSALAVHKVWRYTFHSLIPLDDNNEIGDDNYVLKVMIYMYQWSIVELIITLTVLMHSCESQINDRGHCQCYLSTKASAVDKSWYDSKKKKKKMWPNPQETFLIYRESLASIWESSYTWRVKTASNPPP